MSISQKFCTKCKVEKDITEFNRHKRHKDGRASCCKICTRTSDKNWRKGNKRNAHFKSRYGITEEHYNVLFEEQSGKCKICGTHQSSLSRSLAVDHCHISGEIRGLLCINCNVGLGNFKDNPSLLKEAIKYLGE